MFSAERTCLEDAFFGGLLFGFLGRLLFSDALFFGFAGDETFGVVVVRGQSIAAVDTRLTGWPPHTAVLRGARQVVQADLVEHGIEAPREVQGYYGAQRDRCDGGKDALPAREHRRTLTQNLTICLLALWHRALKLSRVSPLERFAVNLKELRAERGWSQEDLSRYSQLHTTAISKMECGARAPRFPTIVILAEALQVPAGRLFDGIPDDSGR